LIWALANTPFAREAAYVKRVSEGVDPLESEALTRSALSGWPLGDAQFVTELEKIAGRRVQIAKPGRPARPGLVRPG
jgi:putative transposase